MTELSTDHPGQFFGDARDEILERAEQANLKASANEVASSETGENRKFLTLNFPNGRAERPIVINKRKIDKLARSNFVDWVFVGDYNAIFDHSRSRIEASISSDGLPSSLFIRKLISLPGIEPLNSDGKPINPQDSPPPESTTDPDVFRTVPLFDGTKSIGIDDPWRLRLSGENDPIAAEISPFTDSFDALFARFEAPARRLSLKIEKSGLRTHQEALDFLESYFYSLSFELDVRFDIALALDRKRNRAVPPSRSVEPGTHPISPPRRKYANEAVSLYSYGRSSSGRPLFQYLAYYQAMEYFFPSFHGEEVLRRLRNELRDPRFDAEQDANLHRVVAIATHGGRVYATEKDQLLSTLNGSVTDSDLRELISSSHGMAEFLEKKGAIKGVPEVSLGPKSKVVEIVAERVYRLRCRIVHTKADGGGSLPEVLLPHGSEAGKMHYDLMLVQYLCQKVILAGSRGHLW